MVAYEFYRRKNKVLVSLLVHTHTHTHLRFCGTIEQKEYKGYAATRRHMQQPYATM